MINVMFGKAFVHHNDTMFYVVRIIKESSNPVIDVWKTELDCDTVLKKDGNYYFCRKVDEPEVIEYEQI